MRISIVTVCYKAEATIADTIESVRSQTYGDYEHIIVDGASPDGTVGVIGRHRHNRLRYTSEPDSGLYDAMNKGAAQAGGNLIGFLNSDDYFCRTDALACIAKAAEDNPVADAIAAGVVIVDGKNPDSVRRRYPATGFHRWMLRFGHMPPHPGFYTRASSFRTLGGFQTSPGISQDFEWMVRFFYARGMIAAFVDDTVTGMRAGGVTTSGFGSMRQINAEVLQAMRQHDVRTWAPLVWLKYAAKIGQMLSGPGAFPVPNAVRWKPAN